MDQSRLKSSASQEKLYKLPPKIEITDSHNEGLKPGHKPPAKGKDLPLPRRLSKLFAPMNKEEKEALKSEDSDDDVEVGLLSNSSREIRETLQVPPVNEGQRRRSFHDLLLPRRGSASADGNLNRLSKIEADAKGQSSESSSSQPSPSHSDDEDDDEEDNKGYISWDDTICSNRSAYFKLYYQRNLANLNSKEESKSRASTRASSYTSLASLINEKDKMKSQEEKKKKREDIGLMVLVIFLFLVLVIGISLIYYFYHLHLEELSLFKRLKFNEEERLLELFDNGGKLVVLSNLGLTLPKYSHAEDCTEFLKCLQIKEQKINNDNDLEIASNVSLNVAESINEFEFDNETVCLDWAYQARIQIHKAPTRGAVNCYNVYWLAHHPGDLKDCVIISGEDLGVWWGIGEISGGGFPLKILNIAPSIFETHHLSRGTWGQVLRRSFISSHGGIVTLPNHLPAVVSVEDNERLCISVNSSNEFDSKIRTSLNYTICSSPNMSTALDYLHHLAAGGIYDPLTKEKIKVPSLTHDDDRKHKILRRIEKPIYIPYSEPGKPSLTQDLVMEYAEEVLEGNRSVGAFVLLPLTWQSNFGEFTFDPVRFPDPKNMTETLKEKGIFLTLTLAPVISTKTETFTNGTRDGIWIQQRHSSLPVLISYEGAAACALVDFTNAKASEWFASKVQALKDDYGIDHFHLALPDSSIIPKYHEFHVGIQAPDLAINSYLKSVYSVAPPLSTEAAILPPAPPTFVTIGNEESAWESLSSMIPRILTLSLLGYPLIDAGIIGGKPNRPGNIPDDELFIRWVEAASFLPAFQVHVLPESLNPDTKSIVETFVHKRNTLVLPRFREMMEHIFLNSTPLISPLGLLFPEDATAASVGDEWIVGRDLLVAPILHKGHTTRNVYIPEGIWESQFDHSLKQGPGWIMNYKVPLTEIAYFMKRKIIV